MPKSHNSFGETHLQTIIISALIQNIFRIPNHCKVDQLTKNWRRRKDGWNEQLEESQKASEIY
jgi:hypothetical protein